MNKEELREMIREELLEEGYATYVIATLRELPEEILHLKKKRKDLTQPNISELTTNGKRVVQALRKIGINI